MGYEAKSFRFWVSYYDVAQELSPREQGEFYRAIMDYMFEGNDREAVLPKTVRIAFKSVKANLKRSNANRRESGGNRDAIGDESERNRDEVPNPETPLNLNSNLNSNSNSKPIRLRIDTASGADAETAPTCRICGRIATRHPHTRRWYCWKCEAEVSE